MQLSESTKHLGDICLKITSYCVTARGKKQRADYLLSSQLSVCTCLSALVIIRCKYFLISVKLKISGLFLVVGLREKFERRLLAACCNHRGFSAEKQIFTLRRVHRKLLIAIFNELIFYSFRVICFIHFPERTRRKITGHFPS